LWGASEQVCVLISVYLQNNTLPKLFLDT
jgi:hypothetical protein